MEQLTGTPRESLATFREHSRPNLLRQLPDLNLEPGITIPTSLNKQRVTRTSLLTLLPCKFSLASLNLWVHCQEQVDAPPYLTPLLAPASGNLHSHRRNSRYPQ